MTKHVLIVEDEEHPRTLLRLMLHEHNFLVTATKSAEEALSEYRRKDGITHIVSDYNLGTGMNGGALHRALHPELQLRKTRFVAMSGGLPADAHAYFMGAAVPCIRKPFQREEILRSLGQ